MILPFFKIPSPSTRRRKMIEVLETKSETIVKHMAQVSLDADKTVGDCEDAACKIYEASSNRNSKKMFFFNKIYTSYCNNLINFYFIIYRKTYNA